MLDGSGTRKLGGRDSLRAFQRFFAWSLIALCVSLFSSRAHAYAWMIKHTYAGCPACHADPSGGELLTEYGRAQSDLLLRMRYGKPGGGDSSNPSRRSVALSSERRTDANSGADDEAKSGDDSKGDDAETATKSSEAGEAKPEDATEEEAAPAASESSDDGGVSTSSGFLWGAVTPPEWLLLGGSYRHLTIFRPSLESKKFTTFPMMADLYGQAQFGSFRVGGSIGAARVGVGSPYARAAQVTAGQGNQWNLLSRSHWLGYDLSGTMLLRAGHLNLPFGVRIPEHTMWVRQATRTDRESSQQGGVALAYNGESIRGEVMLIAGNFQVNPDKYRERGYSLYAEYLTSSRTAIGISSLVTSAKKDRVTLDPSVVRQAHGAFVRTTFTDSLVLFVEADALLRTEREAGYVGFAQLDFEAIQGLHFMATGELLDEGHNTFTNDARTPGAGKPRGGGWLSVDWFCLPHVEVRADLFSRQGDVTTVLGQLHVFL